MTLRWSRATIDGLDGHAATLSVMLLPCVLLILPIPPNPAYSEFPENIGFFLKKWKSRYLATS